MLAPIKENTVIKYKEHNENIANNYVSIFGNVELLFHYLQEWRYIQHQMVASPFTFVVIFYTKTAADIYLFISPLYVFWVI